MARERMLEVGGRRESLDEFLRIGTRHSLLSPHTNQVTAPFTSLGGVL
jgi:hypothetical protein